MHSNPTRQHDWHFDWLTDWDRIWDRPFLSQWRRCLDESPDAHVYFEPELARLWLDFYQTIESVEPRFMVAEHKSGARALLPMICVSHGWKDAWCRILEPVGADYFDYLDPIFTAAVDDELCAGFWESFIEEVSTHLQHTVDCVRIPRIQDNCLGRCGRFFEYSRSPVIDLRGAADANAILARCSMNVRQGIRRKVRKLERLGPLQLKVFGPNELDIAVEALEGLIVHLRKRWGRDEKTYNLYRRMLTNCLGRGYLHMSVLQSNCDPVSWHLGFSYNKRFYYYKPAFDEKFGDYSPGNLHILKLIADCIDKGIEVFDFLRGEERYKYCWTADSIALHQLRIETPGLRPWATRSARRLLWVNRKAVRRIRRSLTATQVL